MRMLVVIDDYWNNDWPENPEIFKKDFVQCRIILPICHIDCSAIEFGL
jgi:hypothetical protein